MSKAKRKPDTIMLRLFALGAALTVVCPESARTVAAAVAEIERLRRLAARRKAATAAKRRTTR